MNGYKNCGIFTQWNTTQLSEIKDIFKSTKRQLTDSERIFTSPTSDRGLISKAYNKLKKLDTRESNNPIKKWGTELNKSFHLS